jgi:predicted metallopeptidase
MMSGGSARGIIKMPIKYEPAYELQEIMNEIAGLLFPHVKIESVVCIRSHGSSSRGTIARCHALGKAMMLGMGRKDSFYVIEVISKRFDKMNDVEKIKVLIHELMHIPKTFGGGFIHHDRVNEENVEKEYQKYVNLKSGGDCEENLEEKRRWW